MSNKTSAIELAKIYAEQGFFEPAKAYATIALAESIERIKVHALITQAEALDHIVTPQQTIPIPVYEVRNMAMLLNHAHSQGYLHGIEAVSETISIVNEWLASLQEKESGVSP